MSKLFKRSIAIVLVVMTILLSVSIFAWADGFDTQEPEPIIPEFVNISIYSANIEKSGISVNCSATLTSRISTNLSITMVLQKSTSNGYTDVKTWTTNGYGTYIDIAKSKTINILSTYRLKVTFVAGNESFTTYAYY